MTVTVENGEVVIRFPANGTTTISKSGKTRLLATTGGFVKVEGTDISLSLNAIVPL